MTVVVDGRGDFTLDAYRRVAVGGEGVRIGGHARRRMDEAHASFLRLLAEDPTAFIYGVTARPGLEVRQAVPPEAQAAWATGSEMLGTGRGFGGGDLPERVVRGIVFARLADFVEGHAKARALVAERVAALLDGPAPSVPVWGHCAAGEILPMMHVTAGVDTSDFEPGEWMTLVNGSPASAALACDIALEALGRVKVAEQVFALSVEAMRAPLEAYDSVLDDLWGDPQEAVALRSLRGHLAGAEIEGRLSQQAPVSYRVLPRLLGTARRAAAEVERAAAVSLSGVGHNPVYVGADDDRPWGRVMSTGGYHNALVYPALNALTAAWADLALLAERHVTALHSADITGLAHFLEVDGARGTSTNLFGWVAGSYVEHARAAAAPTLLPAAVNDARDDVSSPTFLAWEKARRANDALDGVVAILAVVASQALFVGNRRPAPPLEGVLERVRSVFAPIDRPGRRQLGSQVADLAGTLARAALAGAWRAEPPST